MKTKTNYKIICALLILILSISTMTVSAEERPKVILVFDDSWTSVYNKAFPIMQINGQAGVVFVITGSVASGPVPDKGYWYMNRTQLGILYNASWDLSSHTVSHPYLTQLTSEDLNSELSESMTWLNTAGFTRGSMFLAYPYGDYDDNIISTLKSSGYVAARAVGMNDGMYTKYNLNSPDVFEMKTLIVDGTSDSTPRTDVNYIKSEIDNTINSNGLLIMTFHNIVDTLPLVNEEYLTSDFRQISDYLKSNSDVIDVVTMSKYFYPTISPTQTIIKVTSPNGGETLNNEKSYKIKWRSVKNSGQKVKIELLKGDALNKVISSVTQNDGSYNWKPSKSQATGNDYKIRITSINNPLISDISDNNFNIITKNKKGKKDGEDKKGKKDD